MANVGVLVVMVVKIKCWLKGKKYKMKKCKMTKCRLNKLKLKVHLKVLQLAHEQ